MKRTRKNPPAWFRWAIWAGICASAGLASFIAAE